MSDENQIPKFVIERLETLNKRIQAPMEKLIEYYKLRYKAFTKNMDMTDEEKHHYTIMVMWKNIVVCGDVSEFRNIRTTKELFNDIIERRGKVYEDDKTRWANSIMSNSKQNVIEIEQRLTKTFYSILQECEPAKIHEIVKKALEDLGALSEEPIESAKPMKWKA